MTAKEQNEETSIIGKTNESLIWYTILPAAMQIVRFGNSIILARILSPRDFGIIGIASIITFYCNNLSTFGLGNAIVQRKEITNEHINTFFTFNLIISIILCLSFVLGAKSIADFFKIEELTKVMIFSSLIFILTSFYTVGYTKLRRNLSFKHLSLNEVTKTLSSMAISLPLALAGYQYWSILIASLGSVAIATVTISLRAKLLPRLSFSKQAFHELFNFACWNFFSQQIRLLSEYIDKLIIGKLLGATPLGYYEKSFGIAQMPNEQIANKVSVVAFSTFSRCQGNIGELRYYFDRIFTTSTFVIFPIYFGLFAISDDFILVLLGQKWQTMIPTFRILLAAFMVSSLSALFSTVNISCNNYKIDTWIRLVCLTVVVPVIVMGAHLGIEMVALAILAHNALFLFCSMQLAKRTLALSTLAILKLLLPAFAGASIMLLFLMIFQKYVFSAINGKNLFAQILFGATSYALWFLLTDFKSWRFLKDKFRSTINRKYRGTP